MLVKDSQHSLLLLLLESILTPFKKNSASIFTARPEAQRCQVTPYVVNVAAVAAVAAAAEGSDS